MNDIHRTPAHFPASELMPLRGVPERYRSTHQDMDVLEVFRLMARARALEERLVKISKTEHGYFWIGGPGEEGFNIPLGLLVRCGQGLDYDFLHFHYRSSGVMVAMGMEPIDAIRQMCSRATDPFSGGRNFVAHFAYSKWNVIPGTSTIETQYAVAPGTALAQLRHGGQGITIVTGGDAGSAEGDFATCLNWASRPGNELPLLVVVANNQFGISTPYDEVRAADSVIPRCASFGIRWEIVDGNDPFESWRVLSEAMAYVREERKPFGIEARVSRLHGHSSSSGGARVTTEVDCLEVLQNKLIADGTLTEDDAATIRAGYARECLEAFHRVIEEPIPDASTISDHIFA